MTADLQVFRPEVRPAPGSFLLANDIDRPAEALCFQLGGQEYGIDLRCVQEIRSYQAPTRLAGACPPLLGLIDLRGDILPLLDLRRYFSMPHDGIDASTVTIVVRPATGCCVGVVVDAVNDVLALAPDQIRRLPRLPSIQGAPPDLTAMGLVGDRRILLMDIESLLLSIVAAASPALQ